MNKEARKLLKKSYISDRWKEELKNKVYFVDQRKLDLIFWQINAFKDINALLTWYLKTPTARKVRFGEDGISFLTTIPVFLRKIDQSDISLELPISCLNKIASFFQSRAQNLLTEKDLDKRMWFIHHSKQKVKRILEQKEIKYYSVSYTQYSKANRLK